MCSHRYTNDLQIMKDSGNENLSTKEKGQKAIV